MTDVEFVELRKIAEEARQASARPALWEPCRLYNALADGIEGLLDRLEQAESERDQFKESDETLYGLVGKLKARLQVAEAALQRVRELHQPQPGEGARYCADCEQRWPCPTIEALEGPQ